MRRYRTSSLTALGTLVVLSATLLNLYGANAYPARVCAKSGVFCSDSGSTSRGFIGQIDTIPQLALALDTVSHLRSIIITEETREEYAANWLWRFQRAGYHHAVRWTAC